ncbi:MAG: LysM peptidoglycan-binding domain-containing protein [Firmicutes bacterium]|nr:LysM peptidoglycan-binding domain-containing protein [Bacillota bacterium]
MFEIYRIMPGDSLEKISVNLGINVDELRRINGIIGDPILIPGTNLIIPNRSNDTYIKYVVKRGDTIYDIARRNNIDKRILLLINGLNENDYIYPEQEILIPSENVSLYVTEDGDSLNSISENLGITITDMLRMNDTLFLSPDQIVVYRMNNSNL